MTIVILARHGETDWNRERRFQGHADLPLNEVGRRQAAKLARSLALDRPIGAVYSSDLRRAAETAAIVGRRVGLAPILRRDLREADVGEVTGLTREEVEVNFPEVAAAAPDLGFTFASGEGFGTLADRVAAAIDEIAALHPHETVLVVTHGGPIRAILCRIDAMTLAEHRRRHPPAANCTAVRLRAEGAGLSRID